MTTDYHPASTGSAARHYTQSALQAALDAARARLLELVLGLDEAQWRIAYRRGVNPIAWEAMHVAWFHELWTLRAPHRVGADGFVYAARPEVNVAPDAVFDSARLAHADRWQIAPISRQQLVETLGRQHAACAQALEQLAEDDEALYFHRLGLFHEDMHNEAFVWLRDTLGYPAPSGAALARFAAQPAVRIDGATVRVGADPTGFVFDNEAGAHTESLASYEIDAAPVTAGAFAEFVAARGYEDPAFWPGAAGQWRRSAGRAHPQRWRRGVDGWEVRWFDRWEPLDPGAPVIHVNAYEAEAYCHWSGRRLPHAAEWEHAAASGAIVDWGRSVWEWTADSFAPYAGFAPGPYKDYSAPWFGDHREARGGAFATDPRMHHPRYRNFFLPERADVFVGFRTAK